MALPTLWLGGKEYAKLFRFLEAGNREKAVKQPPAKQAVANEASLSAVKALVDADRTNWRIGTLVQKGRQESITHEASIVNASGGEVFKLKLSGVGVPFSSGKPSPNDAPPLSEDEVRRLLPGIISELGVGRIFATGKGGKDREVALTYDGREVAQVKIAAEKRAVAAKKPPTDKKAKAEGGLFDEKQMPWSGWLTYALLLLSILYWPLKRLRFLRRRGGR